VFGQAHLFVRGGCSGTVQITPSARQCENSNKGKKRRIIESAVTSTYGGFRLSKLETAAGSARRIFLSEGVVQGRSKSRHLHVNASLTSRFAHISLRSQNSSFIFLRVHGSRKYIFTHSPSSKRRRHSWSGCGTPGKRF